MDKDSYRFGYHGATGQPVVDGQITGTEVFLAHDIKLAEAFAEEDGKVFLVEQLGVKPLILDTPEKFVSAWGASGADSVEGSFHPEQTAAFAKWARNEGYDHIVIPASAFCGELGYREVAGRVGEPQTIVLDPHLCSILAEEDSET